MSRPHHSPPYPRTVRNRDGGDEDDPRYLSEVLNDSSRRRGQRLGTTTKHALAMLDAGFTVREIARDLGVTTQRIYHILKREGRETPRQAKSESPKPVRDDTG